MLAERSAPAADAAPAAAVTDAAPAVGVSVETTQPAPQARPEWAPEKFWDPAANAVKIEDLAKSYVTLESSLGRKQEEWKTTYEQERLKNRPAQAGDYQLPQVGHIPAEDLAKLPGIDVLRELAHANGLNQDQFEAQIHQYSKTFQPPDPAEEMKRLGENAPARVKTMETLLADAPDEVYGWVSTFAAKADGFQALEWLISKARGGDAPNLRAADVPAQSADDEATIKALMNSDAYWRTKDPKVVARVEAYWAKANAA